MAPHGRTLVAAPANVFPGLRPFRPDEAHLYFGRDDQVDAMVDRLAANRLLAVLGTSGSGKSSLVNCGLRPALHTGLLAAAGTAWRIASCRPAGDPIGSLARALARPGLLFGQDGAPAAPAAAGESGESDNPGAPSAPSAEGGASAATFTMVQAVETTLRMSRRGLVDLIEQARLPDGVNVLIVVDQFEELFRYRQLGGAREADDAAAFVALLLQARAQHAAPIWIAITMRSDFLGECSAYEGLAAAVSDGQFLVPRLTREERRLAIAGPIAVGGGRIDPVLLTRLVNEVGEDPDQLSILQHALNRTWAHWRERGGDAPLGTGDYESVAVGTMAHALDRHAEQAWDALPEHGARALAQALFRALTDRATDPRGVRRPARLQTLCAVTGATPEALREVIEVFRAPERAFLMPAPPEPLGADTVIDIAHESLMRVWVRLQTWADDEALAAQQLRRTADAAALHAEGHGGLWRDPELQHALAWEARVKPNAAWAAQYGVALEPVHGFLRASEAAQRAVHAAAQRRRALQRRGAVAAFAFLLATGALFLGLWQRTERALAQAEAANLRKMVLQSRAMLDDDVATPIDVALLLSAAAFRLGATNESYAGLQLALEHSTALQRAVRLPGPAIGVSPDGRIAVTLHGHAVALHDASDGSPRSPWLIGHTGPVSAVAFSPDGHMLATAGEDGDLRLWHVATGASVAAPIRASDDRLWSVAFAPDGQTLATGSEDATVRLWRVADGAPLRVLEGHRLRVWALAFSADGRQLASASDDRSVRLWDPATGAALGAPLPHDGVVSTVAFSPDGSLLASAGGDDTVRLWRVADGRNVGAPLRGHTSRVWSVAFSPDGQTLASASEDKTVRLWDVARGVAMGAPLRAHKSRVWRVRFSADGRSLDSTGNDRMLLRWRVPPERVRTLHGHEGAVRAVAAQPGGRLVASAGDDGTIRLWDAASAAPAGPPLVGAEGGIASIAFSPDGRRLASASEGGALRLWDVGGRILQSGPTYAGAGPVWAVAYSPDGRTLATGHAHGAVRLWDAASLSPRGDALGAHRGPVWSVAFSPDGRHLASAGEDATVRRWNVASGRPDGDAMAGHLQRVWSVAFSPDGRWLASGGEDGSVRLWNAATGAPMAAPLLGHLQAVTALAWAPDGKTLASTSDDATVRLWDAALGEPRGTAMRGHRAAAVGVAYAHDGMTLVSASVDGTLRLWDASTAWVGHICAKLTRNLSDDEWTRHVGAIDYVAQCPGLPQRVAHPVPAPPPAGPSDAGLDPNPSRPKR